MNECVFGIFKQDDPYEELKLVSLHKTQAGAESCIEGELSMEHLKDDQVAGYGRWHPEFGYSLVIRRLVVEG